MYNTTIHCSVNKIMFSVHSEVAWTLESNSKLSMIKEEDVMRKTPVDYAGEGQTPRYCHYLHFI